MHWNYSFPASEVRESPCFAVHSLSCWFFLHSGAASLFLLHISGIKQQRALTFSCWNQSFGGVVSTNSLFAHRNGFQVQIFFYLPFILFSNKKWMYKSTQRFPAYGELTLWDGFLWHTWCGFDFPLWSLYGEVFGCFSNLGFFVSRVYCVLFIFISWYIEFLWELNSCPRNEITFYSWLPLSDI